MPTLPNLLLTLDLIGVAVFAVSGAMVASRKEMDLVGFGLLASLTGIGGGSLRDMLLDRPVFWIGTPYYVLVCLAIAVLVFFTAHIVGRRYIVILWADAVGLASFAVLGAGVALREGADPLVAVVMGVMTGAFGGLIRDVVANETPLILRKEIYATCAAIGAGAYVILRLLEVPLPWAVPLGFLAGFLPRAAGLIFGLALPTYKARPGRDY